MIGGRHWWLATLVAEALPIRLQSRGGRKRIVAPDDNEIVPSNKP
jgi:hypothetical protein